MALTVIALMTAVSTTVVLAAPMYLRGDIYYYSSDTPGKFFAGIASVKDSKATGWGIFTFSSPKTIGFFRITTHYPSGQSIMCITPNGVILPLPNAVYSGPITYSNDRDLIGQYVYIDVDSTPATAVICPPI